MEGFDKERFVYEFCERFGSLGNGLEDRSVEERM